MRTIPWMELWILVTQDLLAVIALPLCLIAPWRTMFVARAVRFENETTLEEARVRFENEMARDAGRSGVLPQESNTDEANHVRDTIRADEPHSLEPRPLAVQKQPDWTLNDGYGHPPTETVLASIMRTQIDMEMAPTPC